MQFTLDKEYQSEYFQEPLTPLNIRQLNSRRWYPQTCRKLERHHRTFKELCADNGSADTVEALHKLCNHFRWPYNHERPLRFLDQQTPAIVYEGSRNRIPQNLRTGGNTGPRVLTASKKRMLKPDGKKPTSLATRELPNLRVTGRKDKLSCVS